MSAPPVHELVPYLRSLGVDEVEIERGAQEAMLTWNSERRRVHRAAPDVAKLIHRYRVAIGLPGDGAYLDHAPLRRLGDGEAHRITTGRESPVLVWWEYRGLTLDELARRAHTTPAEIAAIEAWQRLSAVEIAYDIAAALGISVDDLRPLT